MRKQFVTTYRVFAYKRSFKPSRIDDQQLYIIYLAIIAAHHPRQLLTVAAMDEPFRVQGGTPIFT
jgi:hypothetical protein